MKQRVKYLLTFFLIFQMPFSWIMGQDKKANYGNIPDELVAYDRFQKAYIYHFLTPFNSTVQVVKFLLLPT